MASLQSVQAIPLSCSGLAVVRSSVQPYAESLGARLLGRITSVVATEYEQQAPGRELIRLLARTVYPRSSRFTTLPRFSRPRDSQDRAVYGSFLGGRLSKALHLFTIGRRTQD